MNVNSEKRVVILTLPGVLAVLDGISFSVVNRLIYHFPLDNVFINVWGYTTGLLGLVGVCTSWKCVKLIWTNSHEIRLP